MVILHLTLMSKEKVVGLLAAVCSLQFSLKRLVSSLDESLQRELSLV